MSSLFCYFCWILLFTLRELQFWIMCDFSASIYWNKWYEFIQCPHMVNHTNIFSSMNTYIPYFDLDLNEAF